MHRTILAVLALTGLVFAFTPAAAHGGDGCTPGLLKSAERAVETAQEQLSRANTQYLESLGEPGKASDAHLARVIAAADKVLEAQADLAAHQAACA